MAVNVLTLHIDQTKFSPRSHKYYVFNINLNTYIHIYIGNSINKLQIEVASNGFELSAENCHR